MNELRDIFRFYEIYPAKNNAPTANKLINWVRAIVWVRENFLVIVNSTSRLNIINVTD